MSMSDTQHTTAESTDAAQSSNLDIVFDDVSKEYIDASGSSFIAVQNVDERIESGKFVSIVGPSGCGKTTLLHMTHGLRTPTAGEVQVGGKKVRPPKEEKELNRAVVFQEHNLMPWYSVLDNVKYGMRRQKKHTNFEKEEIDARAREFIELVGLQGSEEKYPVELSGGMQQRVNLARALCLKPGLILMDEPFSSLDAQTKDIMQEELLSLWQQTRATVLFITHDLEEAVFLSDEILIMGTSPGRIIDRVTVDFPRPRNRNLRQSPEFSEYVSLLWDELEEEVMKAIR